MFCYCIKYIYSYVYEYFACMHIYAPHSCSACGQQKRVLDSLELELSAALSVVRMDQGFL